MSDIILSIENVSKQYQLGTFGTRTIGGDVNRWWHKIRGKEDPYLKIGATNDRTSKNKAEFVWALRDIDFEVKRGEVLGIIGKNGAGKSTLLKLLSRVTSPTTGAIRSAGRMASLLEVGTGFHPELTGRENIFLNGAILGMTKAEIKRKLDEIIDFSGCAMYIDTPVKRYSSGMTVRLGFAVAAFLDPEILVVDEVLAVGDFEFQKKAIGKMKEVSSEGGRTVLFVSHNMESIKALCTTGMVIENGSTVYRGSSADAVDFYVKNEVVKLKLSHKLVWAIDNALGNENIKLLGVEVKPLSGEIITNASGFTIEINFYCEKEGINLGNTIEIFSLKQELVVHSGIGVTSNRDSRKGIYKTIFIFEANTINAGDYQLSIIFGENKRYILWKTENIMAFQVGFKPVNQNIKRVPGLLALDLNPSAQFLGHVS